MAAIAETLAEPEFAEIGDDLKGNLSRYLGMIRNIDTNMGRLVSFLEEEGLRNDTILVFLTDNGSIFGPRYYNAGMRGMKTELWGGWTSRATIHQLAERRIHRAQGDRGSDPGTGYSSYASGSFRGLAEQSVRRDESRGRSAGGG